MSFGEVNVSCVRARNPPTKMPCLLCSLLFSMSSVRITVNSTNAYLTICRYILRPNAPVSAFNLRGRESLANVDLIPLVSRCGPFAVLDDDPQYNRACIHQLSLTWLTLFQVHVSAVLVALRAEAIRCKRVQDTRMLRKLHESASMHVSTALTAINAVSSIDPAVKERKRILISVWKSYTAALGIRNPMSVELAVEPSSLCPWEVCAWKACICHDKKAGHRLRVCKGCWQVYYCDNKCQIA